MEAFVKPASTWTQMTQHMDERFTSETGQAAGIAELANPVLQELGFDLVRVKLSGQDGNTVQIMIERKDGQVTIEDCTAVSRGLSPVLDAYDPIPGGYFLEVSSPGIDRPLVRPRDFVAWAGHQAKIELKELVDGRRRFKGRIEGFEDGEVLLRVELDGHDEPQTIGLSVDLIDEAKLTVNDAYIKKALRKKPGK
jgi:ribosome maturation factor RimP